MLIETNFGLYRQFVQPLLLLAMISFYIFPVQAGYKNRATIYALYVPLTDHYAALMAYAHYRNEMIHADSQIEQRIDSKDQNE